MAFADAIWDSTVTGMSLDPLTMSLHVATQVEYRRGIETHLLSLIGISRLAGRNQLELPMTIARSVNSAFSSTRTNGSL